MFKSVYVSKDKFPCIIPGKFVCPYDGTYVFTFHIADRHNDQLVTRYGSVKPPSLVSRDVKLNIISDYHKEDNSCFYIFYTSKQY